MSLHGTEDLSIALVINPSLPLGFIANTAAAIGIGIGAGKPGFGGVALNDRAGTRFMASSDRPVPVLQADGDTLQSLMQKAAKTAPEGGQLVIFPAFARMLHSFKDYEDALPLRDLTEEAIDGIGLSGPSKWVKSLTGSCKLLR
jgi:hypothetical protein